MVNIFALMIITRRYSSAKDYAMGPIYLGNASADGSSKSVGMVIKTGVRTILYIHPFLTFTMIVYRSFASFVRYMIN